MFQFCLAHIQFSQMGSAANRCAVDTRYGKYGDAGTMGWLNGKYGKHGGSQGNTQQLASLDPRQENRKLRPLVRQLPHQGAASARGASSCTTDNRWWPPSDRVIAGPRSQLLASRARGAGAKVARTGSRHCRPPAPAADVKQ